MLEGFKKQISTSKYLNITSKTNYTELQKYLFDQRNLIFLQVTLGLNSYDSLGASSYAKIIGKSLKSLINLQSLILIVQRYNQVDEVGFQRIGEGLKGLKKLTSFYLSIESDNLLSSISFKYICEGLEGMTNLTSLSLNIEVNQIQIEGAESLGKCLKTLKNLNNFSLKILDGNCICQDGATFIAQGIHNLVSLQNVQIQLRENYIGINGAASFGKAFYTLKNLQNLVFKLQGENSISEDGIMALARGLKNLKELKNLSLEIGESNDIKTIGFQELCKCLIKLKNLKSLTLIVDKLNNIEAEGVCSLGETLNELHNLETLQLTFIGVFIGFNGIEGLMEGVKQLKQLTKFHFIIMECGVREAGAQKFIIDLAQMKQLTSLLLRIDDDRIDDETILQLGENLKSLKKLKNLTINIGKKNHIDMEAKHRLVKCIKTLQYVRNLSLTLQDSVYDIDLISIYHPLIVRDIRHLKRLVQNTLIMI